MDNNIIFVETTDGFPKKFTANNSKTELIARGLLNAGDDVTIINKIQGSEFIHKDVEQDSINGLTYYSFKRYNTERFGYIKNLINQCKILKNLKQKNRNNILIMGQPYFLVFLIEVFIYKILGYKIGITKTEWPSQIKSIKGIKKTDYWLSDNLFGYFIDIVFPISQYIEKKCLKFKKPIFKIPILANFHINHSNQHTPPYDSQHYFLLCSTLAYIENITLVIDAFDIFSKDNSAHQFFLKLVLSGSKEKMEFIKQYILQNGTSSKVQIYNQIPYDELMSLYKNADGLLIPLQDSIQDKARFSQKIAEYLSTQNPIITNNVGDIKLYFKDRYNAYIAKSYTKEAFAEIMNEIIQKPNESRKIGEEGYKTGLNNFDNIRVCKNLSNFISTLR